MKLISLKVEEEMLARIDTEARAAGLTRTGLLLRPFKTGSSPRQRHQTAGADQRLPEPSVVQVSTPASPTRRHDPKTCRVYKCGQCAAK